MADFNPFYANFEFTQAHTLLEGARSLILDRNFIIHAIVQYWEDFLTFLSHPVVYIVIIAWATTFTIVAALLFGVGIGPGGVVAGSTAAAFQGWMYGGFTPAGGLFATLTSLGMLCILQPVLAGLAACVATLVAVLVWVCVRGT